MFNKIVQYHKICSFILGAISVAALPPYYIFPAAIIAFSGLFYLLTKADSLKHSFAIGYWFGVAHFGLGLSWIANALLVDIASFGWLYPITIIAAGIFFGLFSGLATFSICKFPTFISKYLSFAAFWGLSEWLRSFILTGFPWNLLGTILTFSPELYQSASLIGTYGLSLLTILFCTAPALIFSSQKVDKIFALIIILLLPTTNYTYGIYRLHQYRELFTPNGIKIRLVQPSIPQNLKWDRDTLEQNFAKHIELSKQDGLNDVDFVIWGETASPFPLDIDTKHRQQLQTAIPSQGHLITGTVRIQISPYGQTVPFNSMLIFNKQGDVVSHYDKSHLVPFGEYIPLREYLPSWIRPITNTITNFQAGSGPRSIHINSLPEFTPLICYEIIFPSQVTNKQDRPQWLINLTNDGWYGDSAGPYQHLVSTIMRATEEGLTTVRVANNGISAIITPLGEISAQMPLNYIGILDAKLPQKLSHPTLYSHYGNIIPLCLIALLLLVAFYSTIRTFSGKINPKI